MALIIKGVSVLSTTYSPSEREDGFTLIELLVVIIIIGILAAIAIPLFLDQRKLAVDASVKSDVRNTLANIKTWQANDANANKAVANTGEFISAANGGKVAQSPGNSIGISISSTGDATVCGYNASGKTYLSDSAAYTFSPATGQFTTGSCASGSTTGGTASTGGASTSALSYPTMTMEPADASRSVWIVNGAQCTSANGSCFTTAQSQSGSYSIPMAANQQAIGNIKLTKGQSYNLTWSAYIQNTSDTLYLTQFYQYPSSGYYSAKATASQVNKWTTYTITATASTDAQGNFLSFIAANGNSNTIYLDDVSITPAN